MNQEGFRVCRRDPSTSRRISFLTHRGIDALIDNFNYLYYFGGSVL